jgi:hypothetical protein
MKKSQWIDLLIDNLAGGDCPDELQGRYHPKVIEKHLELAFDTLLNRNATQKERMQDELGMDSWKYDSMTKTYFQPILHDERRDRYYSELPVNVIDILNNSGIRMISPAKEELSAFIPRRLNDSFIMGDLETSCQNGLIFYTLEGKNLYYSGDIDCNWKEVMMKLAVRFDDMDMDDDITIPDGRSGEVFDLVWGFMRRKSPEDIVNDSTAMQTTQ